MPTYKIEHGERIPMSAEEEAAFEALKPDADELDAMMAVTQRIHRDNLLAQTDWEVTKATEAGLAVSDAMKNYRTALRDLPTHENWPNLEDGDWPTAP